MSRNTVFLTITPKSLDAIDDLVALLMLWWQGGEPPLDRARSVAEGDAGCRLEFDNMHDASAAAAWLWRKDAGFADKASMAMG